MRTTPRLMGAGLAGLLLLAGCSNSDDSTVGSGAQQATTTTAPATTVTTSPASPTTTAGGSGAATTTAPAATKVSANNASIADLTAAFEKAGISNAGRWAREVDEYRPYPNDPNLPKLRQELAKYNPGPGVVDQIVATLSLP